MQSIFLQTLSLILSLRVIQQKINTTGRGRTDTLLRERDFESRMSTNSITVALSFYSTKTQTFYKTDCTDKCLSYVWVWYFLELNEYKGIHAYKNILNHFESFVWFYTPCIHWLIVCRIFMFESCLSIQSISLIKSLDICLYITSILTWNIANHDLWQLQ